MFFIQKLVIFHKSGMIGQRNLSNLSMNNIFNVLLIGLQYTLSFKWPDFQDSNSRLVSEMLLLLWNRKERRSTVGHVLFDPVRVSASQGFSRFQSIFGWRKVQ